jgi:LuxR family transcriptional regulator, maltose regulon positive regulatory protein
MVGESTIGMNLLESKLHIPLSSRKLVSRPRLWATLEQEVVQHRLALISAPAGYGKTTLLAEWARSSALPVAWLSLTREEDEVERFLRYLLAAWETIQPDIVESPFCILIESQMPEINAVLRSFINYANEVQDHIVFVLDDYHLIKDPAVHDALAFIIDHLPAKLHFVIASRGGPPLPLARYRVRNQLLEFRAGDLHFTQEEVESFFNGAMRFNLSQEEVKALHAQTGGWVAGLQLAAISLRGRPHQSRIVTEAIAPISGRQRFIADYLAEDVLDQLQTDVQDFLLKTSLPDRLCGPLCDALTAQKNGQAMLENLERENLFIMPLDDQREWYQYHPLFADFLQSVLNRQYPDKLTELHHRAGAWYLSHELPEEAFRHAIAADDSELVIEIFDRYLGVKLTTGEIKVVSGWIDSLPQKWYSDHPELNLARTGLLTVTGAFEAAIRSIDEIEQSLSIARISNRRARLAQVTAVRCFIACFHNDLEQAESYSNQALVDLPKDDVSFRIGVYGALGDTYRRNRLWEKAKDSYLKGLEFTHAPEVRIQSVHLFGALADLELRQGHLKSAAAYWQKALDFIRDRKNRGRLSLPLIGWVFIRMGEILHEWNQLPDAWDYISRGLKRAELGGDVRSLFAGYVITARLKLAAGEIEAAAEFLEKARPLKEQASFPDWTSQFERTQLELWLEQNRLRAALHWSDEMSSSAALDDRPESVITQLAMARVLVIKGDDRSLERALALLKRLQETAGQQGQNGVLIEALALQAMAGWARGERAGALTSLERSLRLAEPEGYLRLFVDLGLPMARILQEARSRMVMADYVDNLLAAFGSSLALPKLETLPEPLTARERDVLKLLAAGLKNYEIAGRLVISPETVKKHTGNIYRKLGASNRTAAAARARELDLLD